MKVKIIETGKIVEINKSDLKFRHRLMCGDSTKSEDVGLLMLDEKADMVFTDPPYGISIVNKDNVGIDASIGFGKIGIVKAKKYKEIIGDDEYFDPTFLLKYGDIQIIWGANNFCDNLPVSAQWLVWDKKCEKGADHNNFSDCELAWTNSPAKSVRIYRYLWSGLLREGSRDIELKERVHPTQKPVGLLSEILKDYSKQDDIVLDLFGGSGSTLMACEQTDRQCRMMEIDLVYCQIIINRWQLYTSKKAIKLN